MFRRTVGRARTHISAFLHEPSQRKTFDETLALCSANGTDMASNLSADFALLQSKLLKYRVVRLRDELQYVWKHPLASLPSSVNLMQHLVLLTMLFFMFRNMGRLSMRSLVEPPKPSDEGAAAAGKPVG